jgi:hypothetical protein
LILRDRRFINDLNLRYSSRASVMLAYGLLAALVEAWWWNGFLGFAGLAAPSLLVLNAQLYSFFQRKRGMWFMLRTIPWYWFYYLYSGLAFAIGTFQYQAERLRSPGRNLSKNLEELPSVEEG